jgi:hypothetical protein
MAMHRIVRYNCSISPVSLLYALRMNFQPIHPEDTVNVIIATKMIHTPDPDELTWVASVNNLTFIGTKNSARRKLSNPNNLIMEYEFIPL